MKSDPQFNLATDCPRLQLGENGIFIPNQQKKKRNTRAIAQSLRDLGGEGSRSGDCLRQPCRGETSGNERVNNSRMCGPGMATVA